MKQIYKETLSKIKASDEAKSETIARMQEKLEKKKSPALSFRKKLSLAVTSIVCVLCICIAIPLLVHYTNLTDNPGTGTTTPPNIGVYSIGQTYTREDGSSVTFTNIRVENNLTVNGTTARGIYLIITGTFDFEQFAFYTNESIATLFNEDIGEDTVLRLDNDLTMQLSKADLHINDSTGGETHGEVNLVYRINTVTLEFITAHNNDTHADDEVHGDITLNLSGCYTEQNELIQFIFFCEDIKLP